MSSHKLETAIKQTLSLTPQLQQAIRILNMNDVELNHEITQMLSTNFMLELDREFGEVTSSKAGEEEEFEPDSIIDHLGELEFDSDWRESYEDWQEDEGKTNSRKDDDDLETDLYEQQTLLESLVEQVQVMPLPREELREPVLMLAYSLDEDGYLREDLTNIAREQGVGRKLLEEALQYLQQCQPAGVGARNLLECVLIQLDNMDQNSPALQNLKNICRNYFDRIHRHPTFIMRRLGLNEEEFDDALELLKSVNPHPGRGFMKEGSGYVQPEIFVREKNGISYIEMNGDMRHNITINQTYARLAANANERDKTILQAQLQEARWFLNALEKRSETIRKVATAIVQVQQDFFQQGELAMLPLTRQQVAEMLGIHESTVSRAVNGKFLSCKRGIFELRYFFSAQTSEDKSTTAIKAVLQEIISGENPARPFSDQQLSEELAKRGYCVARRTIAKYREAMGIDTASYRKRRNRKQK